MEVDNKDENKDNNDENKYQDFELPDNAIPDVLLNKNIEYTATINVMRECANKIADFASDIHVNASQALINLYTQFSTTINVDGIDHTCIRRIVLFLKQQNEICEFWATLHDDIINFENQFQQTIWLGPPTIVCDCNNQLSLKNIRHTYMATTRGIVAIIEKIFRCRQRGCANEGKAIAYNYYRDPDGNKRYWSNESKGNHRQTVFSPYLKKLLVACILISDNICNTHIIFVFFCIF